jgi:hypothetical protein
MKDEFEVTNETADAIHHVGRALEKLGLGNASTQFGAIEALSLSVREGAESVSSALNEIANAIRESGEKYLDEELLRSATRTKPKAKKVRRTPAKSTTR